MTDRQAHETRTTDQHSDETPSGAEPTAASESTTSADAEARAEASSQDGPNSDGAAVHRSPYGIGPFSIREVVLGGVWLVAFVVSFFSIGNQPVMSDLHAGGSVWSNGLDWILTIGLPTVAVFLIVLRRFSPDGIRRVGSLGIDQFASVAFSVSAVVWLSIVWRTVAVAIDTNAWIFNWVIWVEFVLMLAGVVLTVFAPVIPGLSDDFSGRREIAAHRSARPIRPVSPRPARPARPAPKPRAEAQPAAVPYAAGPHRPDPASPERGYGGGAGQPEPSGGADGRGQYAQEDYAASGYAPSDDTRNDHARREDGPADYSRGDHPRADGGRDDNDLATLESWSSADTSVIEPVPAAESRQPAFWALVPEERDVVDERGVPIFRVGPTAWALVLEDRGEVFVVRHEDGRLGYLHEVSGVTRG